MNEPTKEEILEELLEIIKLLQSQVNDLRWRMNTVCNFLSLKFPENIVQNNVEFIEE